jgi:hypothetical protein
VAAANGDGLDGDGVDADEPAAEREEAGRVDAAVAEEPAHEGRAKVPRPEPAAPDEDFVREVVKAPVGVVAEPAPDGYVPMSEWLDDFNR